MANISTTPVEASYRCANKQPSRIQLVYNLLVPTICHSNTKNTLRYRKVSKSRKEQLIQLVFSEDKSIIQASKHLKINYSTAKSIILNHKKRAVSTQESCSGSVSGSKDKCSTDEPTMNGH